MDSQTVLEAEDGAVCLFLQTELEVSELLLLLC